MEHGEAIQGPHMGGSVGVLVKWKQERNPDADIWSSSRAL
jgi:hypothetical protein